MDIKDKYIGFLLFFYKYLNLFFETILNVIDELIFYWSFRNSDNILKTVKDIEKMVKEIVPESPFVYGFIDEKIDNLYSV